MEISHDLYYINHTIIYYFRVNTGGIMKKIKLNTAQNKLEKVAIQWLNSRGQDYDDGALGVYKDLEQGGCQSGMVGDLISYTDTVAFYKKHIEDINSLLTDSIESTGLSINELFGDKWYQDDPLALDTQNQNLLAWFGFEESARNVMNRNGYEG